MAEGDTIHRTARRLEEALGGRTIDLAQAASARWPVLHRARCAGAARLRSLEASREVGDALLDQRVIAGIGNAIRAEALFRAGVSPWRRIGDRRRVEAEAAVAHARDVMAAALASGRRSRSIYSRTGGPCPACGTGIRSRRQGDGNRVAYWCPRCQA